PEDRRRWTFEELLADAEKVAGALLERFQPGERIACWAPNIPEWILLEFGCGLAGMILVTVNPAYKPKELDYVLRQSGASGIFLADEFRGNPMLATLQEVQPQLPGVREAIRFADFAEFMTSGPASPTFPEVKPMDPVQIQYTSGTTGFPKGAMHDHAIVRNLVDRAFRMAITPADTIMMYLPLFHLFGFSDGALMSMVTGARQVLTETFDPAESLGLVEQERATILHGFDTHFKELMETYERSARDVSSVRTGILATGMSSSVPIARKARTMLGRFLSGYGMSEFGVGAALSALDSTEEQCTEASGFPAPGYEIRVVDPQTLVDQPPGVPGEILVRSYMTMRGYYGKPAETAQALDPEGWLHSGDMGIMRSDGHLRFVGRYKDMLKIGGENVDPMEVEAFLMSLAGINLAAVVSFPDPRLSEVGVAFVKREPGHAVTDAEVLAQCKGRIASFKIPRHVIFVDDFPMTSSGKIQKVKLREEALRRITPA
ncbi:MAG: AMP-binding protein, partial [Candidatus Rokuibacteriota bacterium]